MVSILKGDRMTKGKRSVNKYIKNLEIYKAKYKPIGLGGKEVDKWIKEAKILLNKL